MKNIKWYLSAAGGASFVLLFVLWGPPDMFHKTSEPDYCNTCHVMNIHFESWFMSGLHRNIKCVDCHLPNSSGVRYFIWKGIDGMKDLVMFHSGVYSEKIGISDHGKKIVKENCLRCHEGMVSVISTDDRDCQSCHRKVMHTFPSVSKMQ